MTIMRAAAGREVRRQLTSPLSWLMVGVFALLTGAAFVTNLNTFVDASVDALSVPPSRPINVNQLLVRPFLVQVGMAALLVLPGVTAGVYTTRRRLSSSQSAPQPASLANPVAVMAPFVGVLAVYGVMLALSLALVVVLFLSGSPEWGPIASGYLGLLLIGAAFISFALFVSSLATSTVPAAMATFALSLAVIATAWLTQSAVPGARAVFRQLSVGQALDDFAKGVIDAGHIVTCLTIVAVALFVTLQLLQRGESAH